MAGVFTKEGMDGKARVGTFSTSLHGKFSTPNFMPVGTKASVKGVDVERLKETGAEITLVNTYHLWLRPGEALIKEQGGIHNFCGWKGPILSDSGGFQIFSLKGIRKLTEQGVEFRSHLDGSKCFLSPEKSVQIQEDLGVDIAMVLDECPEGGLPKPKFQSSLELTLRWAKRSLQARQRTDMSLFGITQGGGFRDLRKQAAETLSSLGFDGYAIGGLSVGEPKEVMYEVLSYHPDDLPQDKIRYLMGVGTPRDLVEAVKQGVDLFDCVMPTRAGRFGRAFSNSDEPQINLKNARYISESQPIDPSCDCVACRNYSLSYIHHLFRAGEMLGPQLVSIHNLRHYLTLMKAMRKSIAHNSFEQLYKSVQARWENIDSVSDAR
jgi:queuine tRNA-ribosyltransferase